MLSGSWWGQVHPRLDGDRPRVVDPRFPSARVEGARSQQQQQQHAVLTLEEILAQHTANLDGPGFVGPPTPAGNREAVSPSRHESKTGRAADFRTPSCATSGSRKHLIKFISSCLQGSKAMQINWQHRDTIS